MSKSNKGSQPPTDNGGFDPSFMSGITAMRDLLRFKRRNYGKFAGIVELAHQQESQRQQDSADNAAKWLRKRSDSKSIKPES